MQSQKPSQKPLYAKSLIPLNVCVRDSVRVCMCLCVFAVCFAAPASMQFTNMTELRFS